MELAYKPFLGTWTNFTRKLPPTFPLHQLVCSTCSTERVLKSNVRRDSNNAEPPLFDGKVTSKLSSSLSNDRSPTTTVALKVRGCGRFPPTHPSAH
ncbi:hypothetical protein AAC387_Pa04g1120 [Persea americana]